MRATLTNVKSVVSICLTFVLMSPSPGFAGGEPVAVADLSAGAIDVSLNDGSRLSGVINEVTSDGAVNAFDNVQIVTKPQIKPGVRRFGQKKIWKVLAITAAAVGVAVAIIYARGSQ